MMKGGREERKDKEVGWINSGVSTTTPLKTKLQDLSFYNSQ